MKINQKHSWITFAVLSSGHFLIDFYVNILPAVMPKISAQLDLNMALNGFLFTVLSITTSWIQPFIGFACDRLHSRWFLPLSLVWLGVLMCSIGWLNTYWLLVVITSLAGIGSAVYHPIGSVAVASLNQRNKGLMLSFYITIGTLGMTAAPMVAVAVSEAFSLKGLMLLVTPSVFAALLLLKFMPDNLANTGVKPAVPVNFKISDLRPVMPIVTVMGLRLWTMKSFSVFIPHFYVGSGYSEGFAAFILSAYLFSESIGGIIGGYLADKAGGRQVIIYSGIIALALTLSFFAASGTVAVVVLCLSGAAMHSAFPVSVLMAQDIMPAQKNMVSGLMLGVTFGLGSIGSLLTGIVSDALNGNLFAALATTNVITMASVILSIVLLKQKAEPIKTTT